MSGCGSSRSDSFAVQATGIVCEATRLVMVQRLLSSAEFKMDPLVSLYYYAPACAVINGVITIFIEIPKMSMADIYNLGMITLVANAFVAFLLNVSVVLLVRPPTFNPLLHYTNRRTDWQDFCRRPHVIRCTEGHPLGDGIHGNLRRPSYTDPIFRLLNRSRWPNVLQARCRPDARSGSANEADSRHLPKRASWPDEGYHYSCSDWHLMLGTVYVVAGTVSSGNLSA